jgi:hemolysin activation/secretion protein
MYGIFATHELLSKDKLLVTLNTGFDYLDSFNFQAGTEQSRDRMRVLKLGFDIDTSDSWLGGGRMIISPETDLGIADILGGLEPKDSQSSRSGAGGQFIKHSLNLLRLQKMPWETSLLWKNNIQVSPYVLAASQQFQLGGISNVRGYPNSEAVGDQGFSTTLEWIVPAYLVAKDIKVPWSKAKLYDALRFAAFYDIGQSRLRNPQAGEEKHTTLRGYGVGLRFNLPEDLSLRVDLAWPLGGRNPSDDERFHPWFEFSKQF